MHDQGHLGGIGLALTVSGAGTWIVTRDGRTGDLTHSEGGVIVMASWIVAWTIIRLAMLGSFMSLFVLLLIQGSAALFLLLLASSMFGAFELALP